ncbi:hypothetical protein [Flavobacterium sp. H122]|uniref:hypothetical protein n=1 Tax=Flavobacterium sp. H122 TaxID=2529860 RepID=UPI0010AA9636|nr:hypothetical protein [Flavobacterium sp. H122]
MRKKLEAELISIAHRILQLKHKDDVRELHHEAQKLYEKLSVLLFVEENLGEIKPTIGLQEMEEKLEHAFDFDDKVVVAQLREEELDEIIETKSKAKAKKIDPKIEAPVEEEPAVEEKENTIVEEIAEEPVKEEIKEDVLVDTTSETKQISIDDLLNQVAPDPIFERVIDKNEEKIHEDVNKIIEKRIIENIKKEDAVNEEASSDLIPQFKEITFEKVEDKTATNLNDKISKSAGLTLNDRVAFEKNLFDGSTADLNRVISQIATFDTYEDAKNFIEEMVKPDYNDWAGKDEFASRFMEFVQSKFA